MDQNLKEAMEEYLSMNEIELLERVAEVLGEDLAEIYYKWTKNDTVEALVDALEKALKPFKPKPHRLVMWEELKDRAVVKRQTYNRRVLNGMTPEKAALTPTERPNYTKEDIAKAESNGIPYNTFKNRVVTYKWPVEVAATAPLGTKWRKGRNNYTAERMNK